MKSFLTTIYLLTMLLPSRLFAQSPDTLFAQKKQLIIDQVASNYTPPSPDIGDPEKYYWPFVMARLEKYGPQDSIANHWIAHFREHAPFHFTLVGMARIMSAYPEVPAMKEYRKKYLQEVFGRQDSYNAWTAEGTENHTNMTRTSAYLYAQHALNFPEAFPDARQKLQQMERWVRFWAKSLYTIGNGEWNSGIYAPYNIIGWLNLYDFAENADIRQIARAVLDFYATQMALSYFQGLIGGPEMRGSGVGRSARNAGPYFAWLWFGKSAVPPMGFQGNQYIQTVHALSSSYRPDEAIVALARKQMKLPAYFQMARPDYLQQESGFVQQQLYLDNNFSLGSASSPYGGWTGTTYQLINWKLLVQSSSGELAYEISGNGRFYDDWTGRTRSPWTQYAQHRNVMVMLTRQPKNAKALISQVKDTVGQWQQRWERDFYRRFPQDTIKENVVNFNGNIINQNMTFVSLPEATQIISKSGVVFGILDSTLLAIQGVATTPELEQGEYLKGRKILADQSDSGYLNGIILEVLVQKKGVSTEALIQQYLRQQQANPLQVQQNSVTYTSLSGEVVQVHFDKVGTFREGLVDWGYGVEIPHPIMQLAGFRQPDWPEGEGHAKVAEVLINGAVQERLEGASIIHGKAVSLTNEHLHIDAGAFRYEVDFSGDIPTFSR